MKFEALELAEESDTIEAVVINVDDTLEETSSESQQQSSSDIAAPVKKKRRKGAVSSLFSDLCKAKKSKTVVTHDKLDLVNSEPDCYKREGIADLDNDPLLWWKRHYNNQLESSVHVLTFFVHDFTSTPF